MRRWPNFGLLLAHRLRRAGYCPVFSLISMSVLLDEHIVLSELSP